MPPTERPIIFSAPMVRAILAGRKTQTRRVISSRFPTSRGAAPMVEAGCPFAFNATGYEDNIKCPYGRAGDRLWVKETFKPIGASRPAGYWTDPKWIGRECFYAADGDCPTWATGKWKPSIFMPRWASRLTLAVEAVRVERLQEITPEDASAEGIDVNCPGCSGECGHPIPRAEGRNMRLEWSCLWDSINGKRAPWASNPWVWVVTFRRVES